MNNETDMLAISARQQKQLALNINAELTESTALLEDLHNGVDRTDLRVHKLVGKVDRAAKRGSLCPYYTSIIVLVVLIIVLAIAL